MKAISEVDFDIIFSNVKEGTYRFIGSGSGRRVFDMGNGYVVKVAKNKKGIAQNEVEYQIASEDHSELFAKIPKVSKDFSLLIMEKADRLRNFSDIWKYFNVKNNRELFQLEEFNYIFPKYNLLPADLSSSVNWGTINGRPVIIDYGFTSYVRKRYYMPF